MSRLKGFGVVAGYIRPKCSYLHYSSISINSAVVVISRCNAALLMYY